MGPKRSPAGAASGREVVSHERQPNMNGGGPVFGSQKPVSIKDIARAANVSYSTVSRAWQNSPLVGRKTTEKIQRIAQQSIRVPAAHHGQTTDGRHGEAGDRHCLEAIVGGELRIQREGSR